MSTPDRKIGNRVKKLREASKITTAQAAGHCELSIADFEQSERGERRFRAEELFRVGKMLNVGMGEIFQALEPDESPHPLFAFSQVPNGSHRQ